MNTKESEIIINQRQIKSWGYQWIEHIFNDGRSEDCYLELSKSKDFNVFSEHKAELGCGRYSRLQCWRMAHEHISQIINHKDQETN